MSEELENKTEQASPRRLQEAREKGQVPLGHDAVMVLAMAGCAWGLSLVAGRFQWGLVSLFQESLRSLPETPFHRILPLAIGPAAAVIAVASMAAAAACVATMTQTQGGLWLHLALPDLERLVGGSRISRLFTKDFLADLGLALLKVVALGYAGWSSIRNDMLSLPLMLGAAPPDQLARTMGIAWKASVRMLAVAAVLAGAELALQRFRFNRKMKMTKEEARRDNKQDEGDPMLRSRRRKRHRELSKGQAAIEVPRADALIVNPTHVAVAVRYRREEGTAPRVTAKGKGALAEYMRDLARSNGVPIVEDIPLARLLFRKVKVGRSVPAATFKAVATVLAYVYRLTGRSPAREARP
jgi:flagellar biosynthesis protein FlhB